MQIQDVIWGGKNRCELILKRNLSLVNGDMISLAYNYTTCLYEISNNGEKTSVNVDKDNQRVLDNIFLNGFSPATIVKVIDVEELKIIVEIKIFQDIISFNALQAIEIEIGEEIITVICTHFGTTKEERMLAVEIPSCSTKYK